MRKSSLTLGIGCLILGMVSLGITGIASLSLAGDFHTMAANITVPTDAPVAIEVVAGASYLISREMAGPHVSVNRPLLALPPDLTITITDASTNDTLPTAPSSWQSAQRFFGLERERSSFRSFTTPASNTDHPRKSRILVDIRGTFEHDQVYAIGPAWTLFQKQHQIQLMIGWFSAIFLLLFGMGVCLYRLSRPIALMTED
jgi:hypothetical protein